MDVSVIFTSRFFSFKGLSSTLYFSLSLYFFFFFFSFSLYRYHIHTFTCLSTSPVSPTTCFFPAVSYTLSLRLSPLISLYLSFSVFVCRSVCLHLSVSLSLPRSSSLSLYLPICLLFSHSPSGTLLSSPLRPLL